MKIHCPECGSQMKRPKEPVQFDNSMSCKNGHKFDVFNVGIYYHSRLYSEFSAKGDKMSEEVCCMTCKHQDMSYCPFHTGYTGWDDVYCNKWKSRGSASTARKES